MATPYVSSAAEASAQAFASGTTGQLRSVTVLNLAGGTRYVWIYSGTSSAGTLIAGPFPVAAGAGVSLSFGDFGGANDVTRSSNSALGRFTNGCWIASSTSGTTFTAGGSDFRINAEAL